MENNTNTQISISMVFTYRKYSQKESEKSEKESKLSNYILTINMYQMMPLIRCDWMIAEKIDFLLEKEEEL